jgi:hypothetical protein
MRLPEGRRRQRPRKTLRTLSSSPGLRPKTFDSERCRGPRSTSAVHHTMSPPRRTGAGIFPIGSRRTSTITTCVSTTCSQIGSETATRLRNGSGPPVLTCCHHLDQNPHEEAVPYLQVAAPLLRKPIPSDPPAGARGARDHWRPPRLSVSTATENWSVVGK